MCGRSSISFLSFCPIYFIELKNPPKSEDFYHSETLDCFILRNDTEAKNIVFLIFKTTYYSPSP